MTQVVGRAHVYNTLVHYNHSQLQCNQNWLLQEGSRLSSKHALPEAIFKTVHLSYAPNPTMQGGHGTATTTTHSRKYVPRRILDGCEANGWNTMALVHRKECMPTYVLTYVPDVR